MRPKPAFKCMTSTGKIRKVQLPEQAGRNFS
jgi:hypothetical protein